MQSVTLKVKIKALAAEAQIIRKEERKSLGNSRWLRKRDRRVHNSIDPVAVPSSEQAEDYVQYNSSEQAEAYMEYNSLHHHRVVDVRQEARAALIAYGYLRGKRFGQIEEAWRMKDRPDWAKVLRLVIKYGHEGYGQELLKMIEQWAERSGVPRHMGPNYFTIKI